MKKSIYLFILLCFVSVLPIQAQPVMSYGFESRQGTYEEMSGGTVVGAGILGTALQHVAFDGQIASGVKALTTTTGIPIGFNFIFNDTPMNKFVIGSNGYLALGKDQIKIDPKRSAFMLTDSGEGKQNIVGIGINTDFTGTETTQISYKTTGTAPNRMLTVQYKDLVMATNYQGGIATISFQIRLYEMSNKIEFSFNNWANNVDQTKPVRVGLKGLDTDVNLRFSSKNNWNDTTTSSSTDNNNTLSWGAGIYPANGLTYTFSIPQDCEKPVSQPTALTLSSTSLKINGSFTASATADHYLVVMTEGETLNTLPADKKFYKADDMLGNGKVISYSTLTTFETPENLAGAKPYYFHIFSVNSFCSYGPLYNTTNPLTGSVSTKPIQPESLETTETGYDYTVLKATRNAAGNQIVIAQTNTPAYDKLSNRTINGKFGTPSGTLNVGDEIEGGGIVVYKGNAEKTVKIEGLEENHPYYYGAWSLNEKGEYSSVTADTRTLTWGKMPYHPALNEIFINLNAFGWQVEGGTFRVTPIINTPDYRLECDIRTPDLVNGKVNSVTTQWMLLDEGFSRIMFDYRMTTWTRITGDVPYNEWEVNDLFEVQVSTDGTNFTTIYSVNKATAPQLASATSLAPVNVPFNQFSGQKVKVRINWKCYKAVKLVVDNLLIEQKPDCEYPVKVMVDESTIVGNEALVSWTSNGEENAWDIRYRIVGTDSWSNPLEVRSNPYLLTTLPSSSNIELQVRAKCSLTSFSPWSTSVNFSSGYMIPFTENFDLNTLPSRWKFDSGTLTDSTTFSQGGMGRINWKAIEKSLKLDMSFSTKDWVITPQIDLEEGRVHGKLEFDLKFSIAEGEEIPEDILFAVVISTDGVKFSDKNILKKFTAADFANLKETTHFSIDLSKYTGKVKLGFYGFVSQSGASKYMYLDNLSVLETCPAAVNAKATEVTPESAVITWEGAAEEWLTFVRKAGETKIEYTKQTQAKLTLTELTPKTGYEVGITKACAPNDSARVVIVAFNTQSLAPCLIPEAITATPSKRFVTIAWTGEADRYNIRFRLKGTEEWIDKTAQENSIKVDGLEPDTEYEYAIQAVCSPAEGDVSPWTETATVKTQAITCLPPTGVTTTVTHKAATVTWEGEANEYQMAYRTGEDAWTLKEIKNTKTAVIENLPAATKYTLRMRSICAANDSSEWSANTEFTTLDIPVCSLPTNLRASGVTDTAAKLEWDADESNLTWDLNYRPGTSTDWMTAEKLTVKSYQANNLIPNTAYLWRVKASCDEGRTSTWAVQESFNTTESSGIENIGADDLKVYAIGTIINIQNPSNARIDRIRLFDLNGQIIREYDINSDENVMIPTSLNTDKVIVKVIGEKFTSSHTLMLQR